MAGLEEAIVLARGALALHPPEHPDRPSSLNNLAAHLFARYQQLGPVEDLQEAIVLDRDALALCPPGHPLRPSSLNSLGIHLSARYKQLGKIEDLQDAIVLDREALALCPLGHPQRSALLTCLAAELSTRYNRFGEMDDLNEAIRVNLDALALCGGPEHQNNRSMLLNNLAASISTRYDRFGKIEDLNTAIVLDREALALCPQGHLDRPMSLNNLALNLSFRYQRLGTIGDLNEAIILARDALTLHPLGHPNRSGPLNNLALCLIKRYNQLEALEDLNEAIALDREALALRPPGHPIRSSSLNNLAGRLTTRYKQLRTVEDLDEAIVLARDALELFPPGHPDRSRSLNNLAFNLYTRHNHFETMENLNEAIALDRDALALRPLGHPDRPESLSNLAVCLSTRYHRLGTMGDLDEAIILARDALALRPPGHPDYSMLLDNLANRLCARFTKSRKWKDIGELFGLFAQLANAPQIVYFTNLPAARTWIRVAEHFQHPSTLLAYETSLRLLVHHLTTLPSLPQHFTVLKNLTSSLAVDAFSACLRNRSATHAAELLEQGRSVFWSQLTRLRSPLADVIAAGPEGKLLADEFTRQTLLIRKALGSGGTNQHDRVYNLNVELQEIVTKIRELPGLSRFLHPHLFSDLQHAARDGPVIIVNASKHGCDALVILNDQDPSHIPLSITKAGVRELSSKFATLTWRAKSMVVTRELCICLRELWDEVVSPIVDFLQTIYPSQSRIWWCPTAEFSILPLHAAGPFRKGWKKLADLYISSYTPTLTALIRARREDPSHSTTKGQCFLAVGQANASGESELFSVGTELANIGQRLAGRATFTRIEGAASCIARFTEELGKNEWVHLACHGLPNRKQPFESAFALHDGRFTIEHIMRCELENPQFAYLSACHTTVGDEESPDEVIHLASAMQFAGFRSVIGTMWAVDDGEANKIASLFYDKMIDESGRLDHTRAAFALNKTMKSVDVQFDQRILYIHLGA